MCVSHTSFIDYGTFSTSSSVSIDSMLIVCVAVIILSGCSNGPQRRAVSGSAVTYTTGTYILCNAFQLRSCVQCTCSNLHACYSARYMYT
jgi:hypothetical protein